VVRVNSEGKSTLAGPASVEAFEKEHDLTVMRRRGQATSSPAMPSTA